MWSRPFRASALRWASYSRRNFVTRFPPPAKGPRNTVRRREFPQPISSIRNRSVPDSTPSEQISPSSEHLSSALRDTNPEHNSLLSPVYIPEDPNAILKERHPAARLLTNSGLVIQRQLELMNVMLGFEQANRYVIMDANGNHVGYMAEQESGLASVMGRQLLRTHRSFTTHVFDKYEHEVLRFHRPFSWINSRMRVYDPLDLANPVYSPTSMSQPTSPTSLVSVAGGSNVMVSPLAISDMRVIGETQQQWALLRRKYDLFIFHPSPTRETEMGSQLIHGTGNQLSQSQKTQLAYESGGSNKGGEFHQFAYVNEPFLSWDFSLRSANNRLIGSVNRNFAGFAREIFTDTGVYALRMDAAALAEEREQRHLISQTGKGPVAYTENMTGMTLDQRAVMLATAVSIDFDYFSRHSHSGGGFFPLWFPGEFAPTGATTGEAKGATTGNQTATEGLGTVGQTGTSTIGKSGATGSVADGAAAGIAGAGSMAGYEAMREGLHGNPPSSSGLEEEQPPSIQKQQEAPGETPQDFWDHGDETDPDDPFGSEEDGGDDSDWF